MPCYDKKLEASRQDFYNDIFSTRDVDCVVTTGELELLLEAKEEGLGNQEWAASKIVFPEFLSHPGSSSGSYLHSIIDNITSELGPSKVTLETRTIRSDYEDLILRRIDNEEVLFKGAKCYGFRNLQNMVRKLGKETGVNIGSGAAGRAVRRTTTRNTVNGMSSEKRDYDYVEIMACPGGCVNGGGQLTRPPGFLESSPSQDGGMGRWGDKEWMGKVEDAYWDGEAPSDGNEPYHEADLLSREIRAALQATDGKREPFRTDYRRVESEVVGLAVQW
jgi:iron only hydrogenase large subunit-like protein